MWLSFLLVRRMIRSVVSYFILRVSSFCVVRTVFFYVSYCVSFLLSFGVMTAVRLSAMLYLYRVLWFCVFFTVINCLRLSYARY